MKRLYLLLIALAVAPLVASQAGAAAAKCSADSVKVGTVCVDKYEASVWDLTNVAATKKAALIKTIVGGTATTAALISAGAVQRGVGVLDYPCNGDGNACAEIYAVSIAGVSPSTAMTWFQAQRAAANSGKRLLTNAEWQMAAAGTPDPGTDNGTTDCNIITTGAAVATGSRANCVSRFGVFDMVGNLYEWVADWVPQSTACLPAALFANDDNCLAGASVTAGPGALQRGGGIFDGTAAGVFAVQGANSPSSGGINDFGFRAAR